MNVSSRRYANAVVLRVEGRLDQDTCVSFTTDLMKAVDAAAGDGGAVVLDLSGMEYVSSAGLRWRCGEKGRTRGMAEQTGQTEKAIERLLARARTLFKRLWEAD